MKWILEQNLKIDSFARKHLQKSEEYYRVRDLLKEDFFKDRIKKVDRNAIEKMDIFKSYLAVDSAFLKNSYLHADVFFAVAVAVSDRYIDSKGEFGSGALGLSEEEESRDSRLLEGMAFSLEVLLASNLMESYEYVFLDGSFHTYLIKLTSGFSIVFNEEKQDSLSSIEEFLRKHYDEICYGFFRILTEKKAVAIPKAFKTVNEELNLYLREQNEKKPTNRRIELPINVYLFLNIILEKGEYLELFVPSKFQKVHAFAGPFEKKDELLSLINSKRVYYLKGESGRIFKFETIFPESFNPEFFYPFTVDKEFLPLKVADKNAKNLLQVMLTRLPLMEEYR